MHHKSFRPAISLVAAALLVVSAAAPAQSAERFPRDSSSSSASAKVSVESEPRFSLEEIIHGIVFAKGPVAETLDRVVSYPENLTGDDLSVVQEVERRLTESMIAADGDNLLAAFPRITSGDPYQVRSALDAFGASFTEALDREYPGASDTAVRSARCGVVAVCAAVSVAAIALGAAIAVVAFNVAGAVNMIYNQNGLWDKNGVFNGKKAPHATSPTELIQNYPTLSESEEVRRIAVALRTA
jgi:SdpC family antimicrobial peptide